jgi:predicted SAM-dependent methyltransferase
MQTPVREIVAKYAGEETKEVRLNIMCGFGILPGWINIDPFFTSHPTIKDPQVSRMDPRKLEFPDNSVDHVYSYSIEHIPHPETLACLVEWFRVLKPEGKLELITPNVEWVLKHWLSLPDSERWGLKYALIYGLQRDAGQVHYSGFTGERLKQLVEAAGYENVEFELEWSEWTEHERVHLLANKPRLVPEGALKRAIDSLDYDYPGVPSQIDQATLRFLGNPLPNVDYDWIHNKILLPRLKERLDHLEALVPSLETTVRTQRELLDRLDHESSQDSDIKISEHIKSDLDRMEKNLDASLNKLACEFSERFDNAESSRSQFEAGLIQDLQKEIAKLGDSNRRLQAERDYFKTRFELLARTPPLSWLISARRFLGGMKNKA